jgi:histidine triad (HIT) family protein
MQDCVFCKIVNGDIVCQKVYEDEKFLAFLDINPVNPGHLDIIPKIHEGYIFNLPAELYGQIFEIAKKIAKPLQQATNCKRVGMVVEGFGVDHVHLHLVPINKGRELDPNRARRATDQELDEMSGLIKSKIGSEI